MKDFDPNKHHRRSVRLQGYNYTGTGAYFITVCVHNRECLFGDIAGGEMHMSEYGKAAAERWQDIPTHFPDVSLGVFVIMPNHMHGIVTIQSRDTACRVPIVERFGRPITGSIPTIMRSYKSAVTKRVNEIRKSPGEPVWQSHYYEHVIRDEAELKAKTDYIETNPERWAEDEENVARKRP